MINELYESAAALDGEVIIRELGGDGFLMVVELPTSAGFPVRAIAARVNDATELESGAAWLFGQLAVSELSTLADEASSETVALAAEHCSHCEGGTNFVIRDRVEVMPDETADRSAVPVEPDSTLVISTALQLSLVASKVQSGEYGPDETAAELGRMSSVLATAAKDEAGVLAA